MLDMRQVQRSSSIFSFSATLQAVVTGTAVSGVAVSLLRVITKAALPDTAEGLRKSAGTYPIVCISHKANALLSYVVLQHPLHHPAVPSNFSQDSVCRNK